MGDDPLDLTPLDPTLDPDRFGAALRRLATAAEPELGRRERAPTLLEAVVAWRPAVLAAASIALLLGGYLVAKRRQPESVLSTEVVAYSLGVPAELAGWLDRGSLPHPTELFPIELRDVP